MAVVLADFLTDIGTIITAMTTWVVAILEIFTEPPLSIFVAIGIFLTVVYLGKSLLHR